MTKSWPYFTFAAGVIIGVALASLWSSGGMNPAATVTDTASTTTSSMQATESDGMTSATGASEHITVSDQAAGTTVSVGSVNLPVGPAWVAVRETAASVNGSTNLLNTLGAAKVTLPATSVTVPLLRATVPGARYAVEVYRDDAEGAFDPAKNSVYIETGSGAPAISYFSTTAGE